jgi:hypothetical protein
MIFVIDWYLDNVRMVNLLLLVAAITCLTANFVARRPKIIRRTRRILIWIYLIFVNMCYAVILNIKDDVRVSIATTIFTILLIGLVGAIIWKPEGDDKLPPDDGAWASRFALWLDERIVRYKTRHGKGTV